MNSQWKPVQGRWPSVVPKCKEMSLLGWPRALLSLTWLDTMATLLRRTTFPSLLLIRYWFLSVIVIVSIQIIQGVIKNTCSPLLSFIVLHYNTLCHHSHSKLHSTHSCAVNEICQSRQQQNVELRRTPVGKVEERLPTNLHTAQNLQDFAHVCVSLSKILLRTRLVQMRAPKCGGPTSSIPGPAYETGGFTSCQGGHC